MLKKWLASEGGECVPQRLLARQIGKWRGNITTVIFV